LTPGIADIPQSLRWFTTAAAAADASSMNLVDRFLGEEWAGPIDRDAATVWYPPAMARQSL
jgi:TPR repeat protein